jgi:hypothetical protein
MSFNCSGKFTKQYFSSINRVVCPITTNVQNESDILRVHIEKGMAKFT